MAKVLKKFELYGLTDSFFRQFATFFWFSPEIVYFAILLVGDAQHTHFARRRYERFHASYVPIQAFARGTMTYVDGKLHHSETVFFEIFAKLRGRFSLGFGGDWKVEKHK